MGLEAATYVSELDTNNPVASDRKNQGDDHLRLLKSVLKTSLPNLDRSFYIPAYATKGANYTVLANDETKLIGCDTTTGAFNVTLPVLAGGLDGWMVRILKFTSDVNPIYVFPPAGTINGFAKMRLNVPFVEYVFFWTGSAFMRLKAAGEEAPGVLSRFGGALVPPGYAFPIGQSLSRLDYPELFGAWGTQWGTVDINTFNAPDLRDRFLVGAGASYALGATGGLVEQTLTTAQMPEHGHGLTQNPHDHGVNLTGGIAGTAAGGENTIVGANPVPVGTQTIVVDVQLANADITVNNTGGGLPHENRPPYLGLNTIFRLC